MPARDIIVVGASAGGVEALSDLVAVLPADIPAAVLVVMHVAASGPSLLPQILRRRGRLAAAHAVDGEPLRHGRIYVAPPDYHLLVAPGVVRVARGPRENRCRPAIDPLFRSAARTYGRRVTGVILSGTLDDGAAGLLAIKAEGGVSVAQSPEDALYAEMPSSAIETGEVDWVVPVAEMGGLLMRLARGRIGAEREGVGAMSSEPLEDAKVVQRTIAAQELGERSGTPSVFTCPECGGVVWEIDEAGTIRFRCHVGHAFSAESMLAGQTEALEASLWSGVRALEERASLARRLARRFTDGGQEAGAARFLDMADEAERDADVVRGVLRVGRSSDAAAPEARDADQADAVDHADAA